MRNLAVTERPDSIRPVHQRIITHNPYSSSEEMIMIFTGGGTRRLSRVTAFTKIRASVEVCFDMVTRQLEGDPRWDPTIKWVVPVSCESIGVGSKSRVTFDIADSIEEATVILCSFVPNKVIMWTSDHSTQLQEEWSFGTETDNCTSVMVTLSYNPYRGWLKYFSRRARVNGQIELTVLKMLRRLKMAAEIPEQWSIY